MQDAVPLYFTLAVLAICVALSWLACRIVFKQRVGLRLTLAALIGVLLFHVGGFLYYGYLDPFIDIAVVISVPIAVVIAAILDYLVSEVEGRQ